MGDMVILQPGTVPALWSGWARAETRREEARTKKEKLVQGSVSVSE
jgi:hypothetical protein